MANPDAVKSSITLEKILARYAKGIMYELDMLVYFVVVARYYSPGHIWTRIPSELKPKFKDFVLRTPMQGVRFLKGTFTHYWDYELLALWKEFFKSANNTTDESSSTTSSELPEGILPARH